MPKKIRLLLWAVLILLSGTPIVAGADSDRTSFENKELSTLQFERIALMPFLVGKLESPEKPIEKPLSQPLAQLYADPADLAEGADRVMTRLVHDVLKNRFPKQVVSLEDSAGVFADILQDPTLDTPRKLAKKFGENLQADLVVVGSIWRFREKETGKEIFDSPASVAFAVYLMEVASGQRLWRNAFDGTQKALSEDVLGGLKQGKIGLRWVSVNELAHHGVKHVFRTFPLR